MIKQFLYDSFAAPVKDRHFKKKFLVMAAGVFFMGFTLSFLILTDFGTDPYTCMNLGLAGITGISFGTHQFLGNAVLFILVLWKGRKTVGYGTLANMILIGYIADFFRWIWNVTLPPELFTDLALRIAVFVPSLAVFIAAASCYMSADMGVAPYDAVPFMISQKFKRIPFRLIRIIWDSSAIVIAVLAGGKVGPVSILMALLLGPAVNAVKTKLDKIWAS